MDKQDVQKINKQVYKKYPEMTGSTPSIVTKNNPQAKSMNAEQTYHLTYSTTMESNGRKFPRQVRVVAGINGKIIRMSTSK